ncbi:MAG: flippase-like domain-containing protein [Flavobacteriales bacterium]|nr:flippase-like domain-containing protein [Flavobacteriales bacterium]
MPLRRMGQSALLALIGFGIFYYTIKQTDLSDLRALQGRIRWEGVFLMTALIFLSHLLRAWRWQLLFSPENATPRLWACFFSLMAGYLANLVPPRAGEIIRAALLARSQKISVETSMGTVVVERIVDLIFLFILWGCSWLWSGDLLWSYMNTNIWIPIRQKATPLFWLLAMGGLILTFIVIWWTRQSSPSRFRKMLARFMQGLSAVFRLRQPGLFWVLTAFIWTCYLLITWIGFYSLSVTPHRAAEAALALVTLGTIGMIVTPGGTIYPLLCTQLMELFGVVQEEGLLLGWLLWGSQMALFLVLGLAGFISIPFFSANSRYARNTHHH